MKRTFQMVSTCIHHTKSTTQNISVVISFSITMTKIGWKTHRSFFFPFSEMFSIIKLFKIHSLFQILHSSWTSTRQTSWIAVIPEYNIQYFYYHEYFLFKCLIFRVASNYLRTNNLVPPSIFQLHASPAANMQTYDTGT